MARLTSLPTETDDSVGRDKIDRAPVPNRDEYIAAAEWNEVKRRVVELANTIGLEDGSTVGSIEEALDSIGGGGGGGGSPTGSAGGDLGGTYPDPIVAKLQGRDVATTAPSDGQSLMWDGDGSEWAPTTAPIGLVNNDTAIVEATETAAGTTANLNQNAARGDSQLQNVDSPAGEPADASSPYYLEITNGSDTETIVVVGRSGVQRSLSGPLAYTYSAGPSTIAYKGLATTPTESGLLSGAILHSALKIARDGLYKDGRVAATELRLTAAGQLVAETATGNVKIGPTGNGAIKFNINGTQVGEVDSAGINVIGNVNRTPRAIRTESGAFTVDGTNANGDGEPIRYTGTTSVAATFNSGAAGHFGVIYLTGIAGVLTMTAGTASLLIEEGLTAASKAPASGEVVTVGFTYLDATTVAITGNLEA